MDIIVLAGGLGVRLKSVIKDIPKVMAPVEGKPFLQHTFDYLAEQKVENIILAVSYKHEIIKEYFGNEYKGMKIHYSIEETPLDTGGATRKAMQISQDEDILVMNGDVIHKVNLRELMNKHRKNNEEITIAIKQMENYDRFGTIEIEDGYVKRFKEKEYTKIGNINVGMYAINKEKYMLKTNELGERFSIEKNYFEKTENKKIATYQYDGHFLDIGIPEDYEKASKYLNY